MRPLTEIGGRRLPFLRLSVLRMAVGFRRMGTQGQVGDGREEALARYVEARARPGDVDDAIVVIDEFCYRHSAMMNVGDEKGEVLDRAVRRAQPRRLLELGTYCGYSALRMARVMSQDARLRSIEFNPANAAIARRIWSHAGVGERVSVVVGSLGDGGQTLARLEGEHDFSDGGLDLVFIDHDKAAYLHDLQRILDCRWLHPGSVVVADNVRLPGAPKYRAYMQAQEDQHWLTTEHHPHLEYQSLVRDLMLESEYLGG
jgi:catechol O-methyltransferase